MQYVPHWLSLQVEAIFIRLKRGKKAKNRAMAYTLKCA